MTQSICPYCRGPVQADEGAVSCPACATPHHTDCFAENGGCTVFGCSAAPADEVKVTVTGHDFHAPPPPVPFESPVPAPHRAPPPPRPGEMPGFTYQWSTYPPQPAPLDLYPNPEARSRSTFIVLGVLVGFFGAHNFYGDFRKKAIAQLCFSVFTMGIAIPMIWIWALIDVLTVDTDAHGVRFES